MVRGRWAGFERRRTLATDFDSGGKTNFGASGGGAGDVGFVDVVLFRVK